MIKVANNLVKLSNRLAAKDLVDMDSTGGLLADILGPGTFNLAAEGRAGRATAMADAIKKDPGFFVKHPRTSTWLSSLGGTALGALGGGALGYAFDEPVPFTALLGGALGSLTGGLTASALRRAKMKEIAKAFDEATEKNPVDYVQHPLDLLGGTHALGRQEAIAAMRGLMSPDEVGLYGSKPYISGLGDYAGALAGVPIGLGQFGTRIYDGGKATELANKMRREKKD